MLSDRQKEIILEIWGKKRYDEVIRCIDIYAEKWQLDDFELIDKPARNLVLTCVSPNYGSCVFKVGIDNDFKSEIDVLRAFNGRGYCKLYEFSINDKTFLIERILPGYDLWHETTRDERGAFFCDLYDTWYSFSKKSIDLSIYTAFLNLLEYKCADIQQNDYVFLIPHIEKAKEIVLSLNTVYPDVILHGDLSYSNILKNKNGGYTAIDPTGIVGASVLNISKFIISEFGNNIHYEPIENLLSFIDFISKKVNISDGIIKKCLYVVTVSGLCELELTNGKSFKDYEFMVDNVLMAEKIMENL